jgi:hypothetical protein
MKGGEGRCAHMSVHPPGFKLVLNIEQVQILLLGTFWNFQFKFFEPTDIKPVNTDGKTLPLYIHSK